MTTHDKIGVALLIGLFALLIGIVAWTARRPEGPAFDPKDSPIVQQRIRNLQRSE